MKAAANIVCTERDQRGKKYIAVVSVAGYKQTYATGSGVWLSAACSLSRFAAVRFEWHHRSLPTACARCRPFYSANYLFLSLPFLLTLIPSLPPTRSATSTTEIEARKSELRLAAEQLVNLSRVVTSLLAASTFMCKSSLGLYTQNLSLACRLAKEDVEPSRRRRCRHTRRQTVNNFFETYNRGVRLAAKARRFTGFGK